MNGRKVNFIPLDGGDPVEAVMYFTFGYRGNNYAAFLDERKNFAFIDVEAVAPGEFEIIGDESINVRLVSIVMQTILKAAKNNPESYPVNGCHYRVEDITVGGKHSFNIGCEKALDERNGRYSGAVGDDSIIMKIIKILAKTAICAAAIMLFMAIFKDGWLRFFLPPLFHKVPLLVYFLVETLALVGLSLAIPSVRRLGKFAVVAFSTLFLFSGLGAAINSGAVFRSTMTVMIIAAIAYYVLSILSENGFTVPDSSVLVKPLKNTAAVLVLAFIIMSNLTAFLLGVEAPLPKITEKETPAIESSYKSALGTIHPDQWRITDERSRISVLQSITDNVCALELGCYVPTVRVSEEGETTERAAVYNEKKQEIVVSSESLRNSEVKDMITAVLAECRRAWQLYVDGMYDSISDSIDKAYLGLETFRHAVEIDKDIRNGSPVGGYCDTDREEWTSEFYADEIEAYILYRNGIIPENSAPTTPVAPADPGTADQSTDVTQPAEDSTAIPAA